MHPGNRGEDFLVPLVYEFIFSAHPVSRATLGVVLEASVIVGFMALAVACIWLLGPFGAIVWLLVYGLFRAACKSLLAIVGEPTTDPESHSQSSRSSTSPRPPPPSTAPPF